MESTTVTGLSIFRQGDGGGDIVVGHCKYLSLVRTIVTADRPTPHVGCDEDTIGMMPSRDNEGAAQTTTTDSPSVAARGSHGGHAPQTFGECFFLQSNCYVLLVCT